jgi:homoserine dehydrogenase
MLLIQLGVGQVGTAVVAEVQRLAPLWRERFSLGMSYWALADSSGFVVPDAPAERVLTADALASVLQAHASGQPLATLPHSYPSTDWRDVLEQAILAAGGADRVIVVDCAVGHGTTDLLLAARAAGAHIVLCNKDPLTGPYHQFEALQGAGGHGSLHLTATVGAGLPITGAVAVAAASGDPILALRAVASGSLGQLCASMSAGASFPDALQSAIERGYCEPDPRVDLSGYDVARKLLILARLAGYPAEIADVAVESLIPAGGEALSRDDFLAAQPSWRDHLRDHVATARASSHALRYVGSMDAKGAMVASLREISPGEPLARGQGPENIFVLRTERYQRHPLVIAGPGAGVAVTAGAVIGDILRAAGAL